MHLIPPDCAQPEAVVRIVHSLQQFQQSMDDIFARAAQRADRCRERLGQFVTRIEVLERKADVLDQMEQVPVLHCASKYPEVGTPGVYRPVFDDTKPWQRPQQSAVDVGLHLPDPLATESTEKSKNNDENVDDTNNRQWLREAFLRKQGVKPSQRMVKLARRGLFDIDTLAKELKEHCESENPFEGMDLGKIFFGTGNEAEDELKPADSSRIDFSESLLTDLDSGSPIEGGSRGGLLSLGGPFDFDDQEEEEEWQTEPTIELDLPEDLPGLDLRSLGGKSVSTTLSGSQSKKEITTTPLAKSTVSLERQQQQENKKESVTTTVAVVEPQKAIIVESQQQQQSQTTTTTTMASTSAAAVPPPPPPPPPPMMPQKTAASSTPKGDGRADLMAAIRAIGGAKGAGLKKVATAAEDEDEEEQSAVGTSQQKQKRTNAKGSTSMAADKPAPEEDLMTSLARVLAMRRKGISGKDKQQQPQQQQPKKSSSQSALGTLRERMPRPRTDSGGGSGEEKPEEGCSSHDWDE